MFLSPLLAVVFGWNHCVIKYSTCLISRTVEITYTHKYDKPFSEKCLRYFKCAINMAIDALSSAAASFQIFQTILQKQYILATGQVSKSKKNGTRESLMSHPCKEYCWGQIVGIAKAMLIANAPLTHFDICLPSFLIDTYSIQVRRRIPLFSIHNWQIYLAVTQALIQGSMK